MYLFRSSFVTVTFVSAVVLCQCATVFAAPQLGMRPYLHVYGIDASGPDVSSVLVSATAAAIESSVPRVVESSNTAAAETTQPADSSSTDGTSEAVAQTNGAFSKTTGFRIALIVGSFTAALQLL
ncbi:hypothetical protein EW145_g4719 [Phellinidium pouzarii]|uniref:Transmembrane protein n=1 Tax=Phellinidium pouzarii TaxID=167371 RepID=A0A4S4L2H6_9AGAM|nr:hypothetical protein EW145_g4719 [Phellinidium pouzarii]